MAKKTRFPKESGPAKAEQSANMEKCSRFLWKKDRSSRCIVPGCSLSMNLPPAPPGSWSRRWVCLPVTPAPTSTLETILVISSVSSYPPGPSVSCGKSWLETHDVESWFSARTDAVPGLFPKAPTQCLLKAKPSRAPSVVPAPSHSRSKDKHLSVQPYLPFHMLLCDPQLPDLCCPNPLSYRTRDVSMTFKALLAI